MSKDTNWKYYKTFIAFKPIMKLYLNIAIDTILKYVKDHVISIYLIGSFGRGEGALFVDGENVRPLRDFDILIVVSRPLKSHTLITITEEIHRKLGLPSPVKSSLEEFSIWVTYTTMYNLLRGVPLLKYYELKYASIHLYGADLRPFINLKLDEVSLYNGILILLTKIYSLLVLYPISSLINSRNLGFKKLLNYVYEILKMYTEIPTVFSLINKEIYRPRFSERCKAFIETCKVRMPWLFELIPQLDQHILFACNRRKLITRCFIEKANIDNMTARAIEALDKIIALYIILGYNIKVPLSGFSYCNDNVLNIIGLLTLTRFFEDYLRKVLKIKFRVLLRAISLGLTLLYILNSNINFVLKARKERIPVKLRLMFSIKNNFVYLSYIGLLILKSLIHKKETYTNITNKFTQYLKEYFNETFAKEIQHIAEEKKKLSIVVKLVGRLLRLADISLHRKAF